MKPHICTSLLAIAALSLASTAATAAPVINAIYTACSTTGVPTTISIKGTGLCTTTTCNTKPTNKLGGITLAGITGDTLGVFGPG